MSALPTRPIGATGLQVTPLSIGCAALGNMPETFAFDVAEEQALATLRAAFKSPINFLDTAAAYGDGESERRIGVVLRELGGIPAGYVLATKADRDLTTGDFSGDQIKRSVERSLRLLGLSTLQLVYLHDPEHTTFAKVMSRGGPVDVLQRFAEQGVIRYLGIAGGPIDMMIRYVETGVFAAVITHNRWTLLNRSAAPLLDLACAHGLGVVNAAPYGSGILAKGPDAYPRYAYQSAPADLIERVRRLHEVCKRFNVALAAAALQFSLRDPRITSTLVGMNQPERITQTLHLARVVLPEAIWPELDAVGFSAEDPEARRWESP